MLDWNAKKRMLQCYTTGLLACRLRAASLGPRCCCCCGLALVECKRTRTDLVSNFKSQIVVERLVMAFRNVNIANA